MIHSGLGGGSSMPRQQTGWQNLHQNIASLTGNPVGGTFGWPTTTTPGLPSDFGISGDLPGLGSGMIAPGWKPPTSPSGVQASPGLSKNWEGIAFLLLGLM